MSINLTHRGAALDLRTLWHRTKPALPKDLIMWGYYDAAAAAPTGFSFLEYGKGGSYMGVRLHDGVQGETVDGVVYDGVKPTITIAPAGSHLGNAPKFEQNPGGAGLSTDPDHDHGGSAQGTNFYLAPFIRGKFARVSADRDTLPLDSSLTVFTGDPAQDSVMAALNFSHRNVETAINNGPWLLHIDNSAVLRGYDPNGANQTQNFTLTSRSHSHGGQLGGYNGGDQSCTRCVSPKGNHAHPTVQATMSYSEAHFYVGIWHTSNANHDLRNCGPIFGLWDKAPSLLPEDWEVFTTPTSPTPAYKYLCGAKLGKAGTITNGTQRITASGTTPTDGAHHHWESSVNQDRQTGYHTDTIGGHAHSFTMDQWLSTPKRITYYIVRRKW